MIGGPPCKGESNLAHLNGTVGANMRGEFVRVVREAAPAWWLMEAVQPCLDLGLGPQHIVPCSPRWLGETQSRRRYFHSNVSLGRYVVFAALEPVKYAHAVTAANRNSGKGTIFNGIATYTLAEALKLQGLPADFDLPGMTARGKQEAIGNGVPMSMGRAIARAVREATEGQSLQAAK